MILIFLHIVKIEMPNPYVRKLRAAKYFNFSLASKIHLFIYLVTSSLLIISTYYFVILV